MFMFYDYFTYIMSLLTLSRTFRFFSTSKLKIKAHRNQPGPGENK